MEWELERLLEILSSLDMAFINGQYHVEIFEKSGRHSTIKGKDLRVLIHNIYEEYS